MNLRLSRNNGGLGSATTLPYSKERLNQAERLSLNRMSSNTTEGIETCPHESSCTVTQEEFAALKSRVAELEQNRDEQTKQISELEDIVAHQSETIEEQDQRINKLESELKEERETRAKEDAQDRKRLHNVEERLDGVEEGGSPSETPTPQTEETMLQKPETPLEEVIRIPEHSVKDNLQANHQRARFVARDIHQYSKKVPAGRAIKSSELRRVLSAHADGDTIYTQTVSRVIERLDDLGKNSVQVRESQDGERVVIFDNDFVKRVVAYHNQSNTVVTEGGVSG